MEKPEFKISKNGILLRSNRKNGITLPVIALGLHDVSFNEPENINRVAEAKSPDVLLLENYEEEIETSPNISGIAKPISMAYTPDRDDIDPEDEDEDPELEEDDDEDMDDEENDEDAEEEEDFDENEYPEIEKDLDEEGDPNEEDDVTRDEYSDEDEEADEYTEENEYAAERYGDGSLTPMQMIWK
jgi:hypothetical protein